LDLPFTEARIPVVVFLCYAFVVAVDLLRCERKRVEPHGRATVIGKGVNRWTGHQSLREAGKNDVRA
jgi:hypothetical protein